MKNQLLNQKKISKEIIAIACALAISLFYFLFHFHHMQQFLDYDQFVYVGNIVYALQPGHHALYNPHHLHFETTGKYFHLAMKSVFGSSGFADLGFNLRLRSLIIACAGIFFLVLFIRDKTGKLTWGILGGLLAGGCHGYLQYATKIDTGIFAVAWLPAMLWVFGRVEKATSLTLFYAALAGIIFGIGVLLHQYLAFACVMLCLSLVIPAWAFRKKPFVKAFSIEKPESLPRIDRRPGSRYTAFLVSAIVGVAVAGSAYFYTGKSVYNLFFDKPVPYLSSGLWAGLTFQKYLFAYATEQAWGHGLSNFNPKDPFRGYTDGCISQKASMPKYNRNHWFDYNLNSIGEDKSFVQNQLAFFTLGTIGCMVLLFPLLWQRYRRGFAALFLCIVVYYLFFTYWEPFYYEFWLIPVLLMAVMGVLVINLICEKFSFLVRRFGHLPGYGYVLMLIFLFWAHNIYHYVIPYSRVHRTQFINPDWPDYTKKRCYGYYVFKHPDNVFEEVYHTLPGGIWPESAEWTKKEAGDSTE